MTGVVWPLSRKATKSKRLLLVSTQVLWDDSSKAVYPHVAEALQAVATAGHAVFVVSNHPQPPWLAPYLNFLTFQRCSLQSPRQNGKIVAQIIAANVNKGLKPSDIVVLGSTDDEHRENEKASKKS